MYSEELMTYLYSYNLSSDSSLKEEDKGNNKVYNKKASNKTLNSEIPMLHVLRSASVTVPLDFK